MLHLKLVISDADDPQLLETYLTDVGRNPHYEKKAIRGSNEGCFGWTRGVQAITVFFLRWAAWARYCQRNPNVAPPETKGFRPSLAATLNDAITKKPVWLSEMFGPGVEFMVRTNPDFKTVRNAPVAISLDCDQLPPLNIQVVMGSKVIVHPATLITIADKIYAKYFQEDADEILVPDSDRAATAPEGQRGMAGSSQVQRIDHEERDPPGGGSRDLRDEVLEYLRDLANECAKLPYYYPKHLRDDGCGTPFFDTVRQVVSVVQDRRAFHNWLKRERERARQLGVDSDALAYSPRTASPDDEGQYICNNAIAETIPWDDNARRRFRQATILGDPGCGKSWLLRYEARQLASRAIGRLTDGASIHDIDLPILLRLPDLAPERGTFEDIIVTRLRQKHSGRVSEYVRTQIASGRAILLLDAWDEVADIDIRRKLKDKIHDCRLSTRILLTSRIVGYDLTPPPLPESKEVELVAWKWEQIQSFVQIWFGAEEQSAKLFLRKLKEHPQFRGLARIPLMLMLLCRACPEGDFPERWSDVYEKCLWGLLRDWHGRDKGRYTEIQLSETYIEELIEVLAEASVGLLEKGKQQFRETDLRPACDSFLRDLHKAKPWHELVHEEAHPSGLVKRFKDDGVLSSATSDGRELRFLHLTFQEYLAARALAKRPDCISDALTHVYEPGWNQVLVMLGGVLRNPGPYVAALLRKNREDVLCRPLFLAVQASAQTGRNGLTKEFFEGIADEMVGICMCENRCVLWGMAERVCRHLHQAVERLTVLARRESRVAATAIDMLREIGSERGVPGLIEALRGKKKGVRRAAALALGATGSEQAVPALIEALRDKDGDIHLSAAWALARIGSEQAVPAFIEALRDKDRSVRFVAASTLGKSGSEQAVPALIEMLRCKEKSDRWVAATALGKIGSEQVVPALIETLRGEQKGVLHAAARALGEIPSGQAARALIKSLRGRKNDIRYAAARALGEIGSERAVRAVVDAMGDEDDEVRKSAALALSAIGSKRAVPALIEALRDRDQDVRCAAAVALGEIGSDQAVPALSETLGDRDPVVRCVAAVALAEIGSSQAVPALIEALRNKDKDVRCAAAWALGEIGSEQAVPILVETLGDKNKECRWWAAIALREIGSERAGPALIEALRDKDARFAVVWALGKIGFEQAVPILVEALGDKNKEVRKSAAVALGRRGSEQAVPALIETLRDRDKDVRAAASWALGKIGSERAVPSLLEAVGDKNREVRKSAALALRTIGSERATPIPTHAWKNQKEPTTSKEVLDWHVYLQSLAASLDRLADLCENPKK